MRMEGRAEGNGTTETTPMIRSYKAATLAEMPGCPTGKECENGHQRGQISGIKEHEKDAREIAKFDSFNMAVVTFKVWRLDWNLITKEALL